jgi:hypothetical protein
MIKCHGKRTLGFLAIRADQPKGAASQYLRLTPFLEILSSGN